MKPCLACHDTSPDDARFCITCGHSFVVTGATQRMSSAGAQTMRLEGGEPSSMASVAPVGLPPVGGAVGADWVPLGSAPYRVVYAGGNNAGSVYIPMDAEPIYRYDQYEPVAYLMGGSIVKVQS